MPWAILLDWRFWLGAAFVALGIFAAVQTSRLDHEKTEFARFRADTERLAAQAKVRNAEESARQAQHAQEALDDLSTRYNALNARYSRLRAGPGSGGVPNLSSAAPIVSACPGKPDEPDPVARFLAEVESRVTAILEGGDKEIGKYAELWRLEQANAAKR